MLISMTGFGRGEFLSDTYNLKTEIKTVNHRYNDISIRMPRYLNFLEEKVKREIKKHISRGKIDVFITLEYLDETSLNIELDLVLAKEIHKNLLVLKDELEIKPEIKVDNILKLGDIFKIERKVLDDDALWIDLKKSLNLAIQDLMSMKNNEGENLKGDMLIKLDKIQFLIEEIGVRGPSVVLEYKDKLNARIDELLGINMNLDSEKLAEEVAFFADKSNIDEEITRLNSHINQYKKIMEEEEPVGRKLDFLIQEMNREINTIGSKSGDVSITNNVVEVKSEIEKLREQVQNIE